MRALLYALRSAFAKAIFLNEFRCVHVCFVYPTVFGCFVTFPSDKVLSLLVSFIDVIIKDLFYFILFLSIN